MDSTNYNFPPREIIEQQAAEMPPKVPLWEYNEAMHGLKKKGYSYGEIAEWISDRLGVKVTRNRVAYVMNAHPMVQELEKKEEEDEELTDEALERELQPAPPPLLVTKTSARKKKAKS